MVRTETDGTGENGPELERVLWRLQPFPDNYIPQTFLAGLSKNRNQCFLKSLSRIAESLRFYSKCTSVSILATDAGCMHCLPTPLHHLHLFGRLYRPPRSYSRSAPVSCPL